MIVVDASVLMAYLDPDDVHHDARSHCSATRADLVEIGVEVDRALIDPMLLARLRVETGCTLPDCRVLAVAMNRAGSMATFDERLQRYACLRVEPGLRPPRSGEDTRGVLPESGAPFRGLVMPEPMVLAAPMRTRR